MDSTVAGCMKGPRVIDVFDDPNLLGPQHGIWQRGLRPPITGEVLLSQCSAERESRDSDPQSGYVKAQASLFTTSRVRLSTGRSGQRSALAGFLGRYGLCLGGLRLSEEPPTQTQLAVDCRPTSAHRDELWYDAQRSA